MAKLEALDRIKPITDPAWQHVYDNRKVDKDKTIVQEVKSSAPKEEEQSLQMTEPAVDEASTSAVMNVDPLYVVGDQDMDEFVQNLHDIMGEDFLVAPGPKPMFTQRKPVWASGTGFGTYNTNYENVWNSQQSNEIQQAQDESIRLVLASVSKCIRLETNSSIVESWRQELRIEDIVQEVVMGGTTLDEGVNMMNMESPQAFLESIRCSGIFGCLVWYLQGKNILEISQRKGLYLEVVVLLGELCRTQFLPLFQIDVVNAVAKLNTQGQRFLKMSEGCTKDPNQDNQDQTILVFIFKILQKIHEWCSKNVVVAEEMICNVSSSCQKDYVELLSPFKVTENAIASTHAFRGEILPQIRTRSARLAKEFAGLEDGLPINPCSSIFVCQDESQMDLWRALIIGPEETPYSCGCFIFDISFPAQYPAVPPKVLLKTTGQGRVRFNPNLYNCGKVCLSLLGTWSGRQGEQWDSNSSSVLQVLISIQSLILVPDPYFNEPGSEMSSSLRQDQSIQYSKNIRMQTMRYAILDMLKNPPPEFSDVIKLHFKLRKQFLLEQCQKWVEEQAQEPQKGENKNIFSPAFIQSAQSVFEEIQQEIEQL
eukprot:TRINITY_DN3821_c0_g1_i2.p1 TRINITY_DN3821_c0_g1~~TRINITY_DN3821_c0_g1_i2.p1  ORF type:complete len:595 (-),score=63.73 TRINITY_DN3821_c0_g1_i2:461-2245(-)